MSVHVRRCMLADAAMHIQRRQTLRRVCTESMTAEAHFIVAKNLAALSGGSPSPVDDATSTTKGVFSADRPSHPSSLHDITCSACA